MEKDFDFNSIGKRMPYRVPDGFFDTMEQQVMTSLSERSKARRVRLPLRTVLLAAAAAVALFVVVRTTLPVSEPVTASADDFSNVELAFNNLTADDQEFLIAVYSGDAFIDASTLEEEEP